MSKVTCKCAFMVLRKNKSLFTWRTIDTGCDIVWNFQVRLLLKSLIESDAKANFSWFKNNSWEGTHFENLSNISSNYTEKNKSSMISSRPTENFL